MHQVHKAHISFSSSGENFPQGFKNDTELQQRVDFVHWEPSKRPVVSDPPAADPTAPKGTEPALDTSRHVAELAETDPKKKKRRADYMNTYTFYYWLLLLQKHVVSKDPLRQILLLVDNCSCHQKAADIALNKGHIPNITVEYLPKNSTSVTQPLDAGIIAVFKMRYKEFITVNLVSKFLCKPVAGTDADADADANDDDDIDANNSDEPPQGQTSKGKGPKITQKKKKITTPKISNIEGWKFVVEAWDLVKPEAIRHCFHHVPIIGKEQKTLLDTLDHNTDVSAALKASQQNTLTRVRSLAGAHALVGIDPPATTDNDFDAAVNDGISDVYGIDDCNDGNCIDGSSGEAPNERRVAALEEHAVKILNAPSHLSFLISKMLDGMPYLEKVVTEESEGDPYFTAKFKAAKTGALALDSDDVSDDVSEQGSSDEDYVASPLKTNLFLTGERGSPRKLDVLKLTRASSFATKLILMESSADSGSDAGTNDETTTMELSVESFIRGQIHEKLMEAAKLMGKLPQPSVEKISVVDLLADSILTRDYTDTASSVYFNKFITEQTKALATHKIQQAQRREKRRAEKKSNVEERERVEMFFRKRSRQLKSNPFTEVEE